MLAKQQKDEMMNRWALLKTHFGKKARSDGNREKVSVFNIRAFFQQAPSQADLKQK